MTDKHKYRVNVYLGKETYNFISELAEFMGIAVATATKILLNTGVEVSKALENQAKQEKGGSNGSK